MASNAATLEVKSDKATAPDRTKTDYASSSFLSPNARITAINSLSREALFDLISRTSNLESINSAFRRLQSEDPRLSPQEAKKMMELLDINTSLLGNRSLALSKRLDSHSDLSKSEQIKSLYPTMRWAIHFLGSAPEAKEFLTKVAVACSKVRPGTALAELGMFAMQTAYPDHFSVVTSSVAVGTATRRGKFGVKKNVTLRESYNRLEKTGDEFPEEFGSAEVKASKRLGKFLTRAEIKYAILNDLTAKNDR